jgi:BioD-like phosphotransacetylase family protein
MKNLFIMGYPGSGKTMAALGLALKFQEEGKKVSYFKPVGIPPRASNKEDEDAVLMKEVLGMEASIKDIVPCRAGQSYLSTGMKNELVEAIDSAYQKISNNADIVIIDGAVKPHIFKGWGLDDISLASKFQAKVLVTVKIENDFSLDETIFLNELLQLRNIPLLGNLFNNIPWPLVSMAKSVYAPILEEKGYKTLGVIPRSNEIAAPTVDEFYKELGGDILAGHENLNLLVEDIMVGAMSLEGAVKYLRRSINKAVVLGGDRSDIALAALETGTSALILTGGLYPDIKVVAKADEKGIPVILVHYDTYTTIELLNKVTRHIIPEDKSGIMTIRENIEKYCQWEDILKEVIK